MHDGFRKFIMTCFFSVQHLDLLPKIAYIHPYGMKITCTKKYQYFQVFSSLKTLPGSFGVSFLPKYLNTKVVYNSALKL